MASDQFQPYDPGPPRKTGSGSKLLIILGVIFLILVVLCCGGLILFGVLGSKYMGDAVSNDPAVVRQVTAEIVSIDIPEQFQPVSSMNMKVPFQDTTMMTMVFYADAAQGSTLVLSKSGDAFPGREDQMQMQMEQSLDQQNARQPQNVNITERYEREIEIRGQTVTFQFGKGEAVDSKKARIEVRGTFQGPNGPVMLIVNADEETFGEDKIVAMLESIE